MLWTKLWKITSGCCSVVLGKDNGRMDLLNSR
jgi:hypothetical protein